MSSEKDFNRGLVLLSILTGVFVNSATVTTKCESAIRECVSNAVASPACRSPWWSLLVDSVRTDHNNDCAVTRSDILADLEKNYDTGKDGRICKSEWVSHRTGYLGFSEQFSIWHWDKLVQVDCVGLKDWTLQTSLGDGLSDDEASADVKTEFLDHTTQLLVEFCTEDDGARMRKNRDCLSLTILCRENRPDLTACHIPQVQNMTVQEKVLSIQRSRDLNGDGVISREELQSLFTTQFDTNGDQCINLKEWTTHLTKVDHLSERVAKAEFLASGGDLTRCVPVSDLVNAYGKETKTYRAATDWIGTIASLCAADLELYDTVTECAQMAYTCLNHFPTMAPCQTFLNQCGILNARECISELTTTQCPDKDGQLAMAQELTRMDNHINDICEPEPLRLVDDPVSSGCRAALVTCAEQTITGAGLCSNTWAKLQLDMVRRDVTNNCLDDEDDVMFDLRNNYDANGDGQICQDEWQTRRLEYLGLSEPFSLAVWQEEHKKSCLPLKEFFNATVDPAHTASRYKNQFVERLIKFCETDDNMEAEPDCYGLPDICKEKMPGLMACGQFGLTSWTLEEKLWREARAVDSDGDGTITEADMEAELHDTFDSDDDNCVSLEEWKSGWSSIYQLSPDFGQFYYRHLLNKGDCLKVGDMKIPDEGIPVSERPAMLLEVLIEMCEADSDLYQTLAECGQVSGTCLDNFRSLPACKPYLDSCGMEQYVSCVEELVDGACASAADQWEVRTETARTRNQVKVKCKAQSVLATFDIDISNGGSQVQLAAILLWFVLAANLCAWNISY